ncbi:MAG: cytochrome c [Acidobacteriia bacterium]|nr:cytochrome c [Terriglobia bacterium]
MKRIHLFALSFVVTLGLILPLTLSSADDKKAAEGEAIYKKNCNMCHFPDKADKKLGPGLKDLFKNKELPQSHKPVTEAAVREQIEKGSKAMPAFGKKLSAGEIDSLIEYLKTL